MTNPFHPYTVIAALVCLLLTACGGGPPTGLVHAEIEKAVFAANTAMFVGSKDNAEVIAVNVGPWEEQKMGQNGPTLYNAKWTAKLRFKEPIGCILAELDGKPLVKVVADKGEELPF